MTRLSFHACTGKAVGTISANVRPRCRPSTCHCLVRRGGADATFKQKSAPSAARQSADETAITATPMRWSRRPKL